MRSPKWVLGHLLALAAVVAFVSLGLWQLQRLDQRQAYNALLTERLASAPAPLAELTGDVADLAYRRVVVEGEYRAEEEVLLSTRSRNGRPGHHILTPLESEAGPAVIVDRGWVPLAWGDPPPVEQARPPGGSVRVEGVLFPSQEAARWGSLDGEGVRLEFVSAVDVARLGEVVSGALYPLYVLAAEQAPAQPDGLPAAAQLPVLTEGNHASYAGQWFLFASIVGIGYPILLRRTARERAMGR